MLATAVAAAVLAYCFNLMGKALSGELYCTGTGLVISVISCESRVLSGKCLHLLQSHIGRCY